MGLQTAKKALRMEVWSKLQTLQLARFPLPPFGRIPNFEGSETTADRVKELREWKRARVVFVNPDYAQRKVIENTLVEGKILIMASPKLKQGFVLVNPVDVKGFERDAATIRGAFKHGRLLTVEDLPKPDLIVEGSVAVDLKGHRLGKGGGYGDVEIRTLRSRFGPVPVVTTVHEVQLVESVPFQEKDENVCIIVTPIRTIRASSSS